jgi:hypothetical protein
MQWLSKANGVLVPVVLFLASLALPAPATAQDRQSSSSAQVTASDIQRLQDAIYDAGLDVRRLQSHGADLAERLQGRLDDLRDEVVYLKVKQRKDGVSRAEYNALRDAIDGVRTEARSAVPAAGAGARPAATTERGEDTRPAQQGTTARPNEVPVGTELDVRLEKPISSDSAQVEDRFTATTVADLYNGNRVLIPAGSAVRGVVTSVNKAGRVDRTGKLTLAFDRVTVDGKHYGGDRLLVTTEEGTYTLDEMATMTDFSWGFGEIGTITVLDPRDFERYFNGGVHVIEVGIDLRVSYANFSVKKTKVLRKV